MTGLNKLTKSFLVATSLTIAGLGISANATELTSQPNPDLVAALQKAFSAQISAMSVEINREISATIDQGLIELGLSASDGEATQQGNQAQSNQSQDNK